MLSCSVDLLTLLIGCYRSLLRRGFHCRDSWLVLGVSPVRPQLAAGDDGRTDHAQEVPSWLTPSPGSSLREGDAFQSYWGGGRPVRSSRVAQASLQSPRSTFILGSPAPISSPVAKIAVSALEPGLTTSWRR